MENSALLDGVGFIGNVFELALVVAIVGSASLVFFYLWRQNRLDFDQEAALNMVQADDHEPK